MRCFFTIKKKKKVKIHFTHFIINVILFFFSFLFIMVRFCVCLFRSVKPYGCSKSVNELDSGG